MTTTGWRGRPPIYWLRWALLLPGVGMAFVMTGVVSAVALLGLFRLPEQWIGVPCAFAWVTTAYLIAPDRKLLVGTTSLVLGALAAGAMMEAFGRSSRGGTLAGVSLPFLATCASGLAALAGGFLLELRKAGGLAAMAPGLGRLRRERSAAANGNSGNNRRQAMSVVGSVRNYVKSSVLVRVCVAVVLGFVALRVLWAGGARFIEIVQQDQRGLYLRMGRYVRTVGPGLHFRIPVLDHVLRVSVKERQGYIQHVDAMTQDNVIMKVSLQYTYEVSDPKVYRLEVENPDQIVTEFVQGKLRDIVNTTTMNDVMRRRMELNQRITMEIQERQKDYGIHFKLIQIQGTYPPAEVQEAIKQRMVVEQRTVAAREEATQKQILADANLYDAQKRTEAEKFKIEETAKAQKESIRMLFEELARSPALGAKYMDYLTAQEIKGNSKWIITGGAAPQLHLRADE